MLSITTNVLAATLKGRRLHFSFASVTRKRLKKMPYAGGASPIGPSWGVPPPPGFLHQSKEVIKWFFFTNWKTNN